VGRIPPACAGGAYRRRISEADIKEIILQQAIYCGVPAANHAFKEAAEVMAEMAKAK
jgi:alkylhydroperoxidase/carboxymuconolactone decarboxylase family protein YurZ